MDSLRGTHAGLESLMQRWDTLLKYYLFLICLGIKIRTSFLHSGPLLSYWLVDGSGINLLFVAFYYCFLLSHSEFWYFVAVGPLYLLSISYLWEEWKERNTSSSSDTTSRFSNLNFISLEVCLHFYDSFILLLDFSLFSYFSFIATLYYFLDFVIEMNEWLV